MQNYWYLNSSLSPRHSILCTKTKNIDKLDINIYNLVLPWTPSRLGNMYICRTFTPTLINMNKFSLMEVYKLFINSRMKPWWLIFIVSLTEFGTLDMSLRIFPGKFNHGEMIHVDNVGDTTLSVVFQTEKKKKEKGENQMNIPPSVFLNLLKYKNSFILPP